MLIPKVEQRIDQYLNYLEKNSYRKIADLEFEIYETGKACQSPPEGADWKKIKTPAPWGREWNCFWFRSRYTAPLSNTPLFLAITPNSDSLAFIDGKPAGAFNAFHRKIRVDADGKEHTLHIESYSGHFFTGVGPLEGRSVMNSAKKLFDFPNTFEGGSLLERRSAVHSLFYDIRALYDTAKIADANSLRKAQILKGISEALAGVSLNMELPGSGDELEKQAEYAAKLLAPLLAQKNSTAVVAMHLVGHAHIDHGWLWPISETKRKIARTFSNMLRFAKEYPEFIFFQSQPCQLEIIKNEYPDIFTGIQEAYKNGNWEPNGGMWVEADCNIPSGESFVRQFLVGKKVNRELLGYEADTLWIPDVFGYSAALPQIMAGCRIKYFITSKISWNDTTRFPYDAFIWRGIDKTGIKTLFLPTGYNCRVTPDNMASTWNKVQHKEVQSACVMPIGEGDGCGGTLRADFEMARRLCDMEGAPRAAWKTVSTALDAIFAEGEFPEWRGELYLEFHRGTYTTQSRTKRNNRMMEFALRNAELFCAIASLDDNTGYPYTELLDCWKRMLTLQFHDIIPGSSIRKVYAEAEEDSKEILTILSALSEKVKKSLVELHNGKKEHGSYETIFFFNNLSWEWNNSVAFSWNSQKGAKPENVPLLMKDGTAYPLQFYRDLDNNEMAIGSLQIPPLGWAFYKVEYGITCTSPFIWANNILETPFYKITFNDEGRIASLFDRGRAIELVAPGGAFNALISAEDVPVFWDAWDIDADWVKHITQEIRLVSTAVTSDGSECFRLRREYNVGVASRLVQDMVCYRSNPRIDFETKVNWHEKHRMLKVQFDTAIDATQVRCEVQYGHIWRNTHSNLMQDRAQFEICAHKWISLEEEGGGIALLNDCKYGHDVNGGTMRLSLLRSPIAPDPEADQGEHRFTYAIMPFAGSFGNSGVIRSAYELNSPAAAMHDSGYARSGAALSLCSIDGSAVIIESIKAPENNAGNELILRMYESLGGRHRTVVHFSRELCAAAETDMLEDNPRTLPVQCRDLSLEFRAFEIKTIRVRFS